MEGVALLEIEDEVVVLDVVLPQVLLHILLLLLVQVVYHVLQLRLLRRHDKLLGELGLLLFVEAL